MDFDSVKKEIYYRPLGGGIEFGEYGIDAIQREFQEELGVDLNNLKYLFTMENIFTLNGNRGHEIVENKGNEYGTYQPTNDINNIFDQLIFENKGK